MDDGVTGDPMGYAARPAVVAHGHEEGFAITLLPRMEERNATELPTNQLDVT